MTFKVNLVPSEGNPPTFSQLMCLSDSFFHQAVDSDLLSTYNTDEDSSASLSKCLDSSAERMNSQIILGLASL